MLRGKQSHSILISIFTHLPLKNQFCYFLFGAALSCCQLFLRFNSSLRPHNQFTEMHRAASPLVTRIRCWGNGFLPPLFFTNDNFLLLLLFFPHSFLDTSFYDHERKHSCLGAFLYVRVERAALTRHCNRTSIGESTTVLRY